MGQGAQMQRWRFSAMQAGLVSLAMVASLVGCAAPPTAGTGSPVPLRLIAFNDFHGQLEPADGGLTLSDPAHPGATLRVATGGAPALAGLIRELRAGAAHSLVIATGDSFGAAPLVSTLFRHESTVAVLNQMGVDAAALGNHELDAGSAELMRLLRGGCDELLPQASHRPCALGPHAGAHYPMLAANVWREDGQTLLAPSWTVDVDGIKVGIIGAVIRHTAQMVMAEGIRGLSFEDEAAAVNRAALALQARGVHALVLALHEGGEVGSNDSRVDWNDESCPGLRGAALEIVERLTPAVDVVLSAHTHQGYRCRIGDRPLMQAYSAGRGVSVVDLQLDRASGRVDRAATRSRNLPVLNDRTDPAQRRALLATEPAPWGAALAAARIDEATDAQVRRYAAAAAPWTRREVGPIGGSFDRRGRTDSAAGRLIADAQLAATRDAARGGAQLALMNPGGVRADLACRSQPPCVVTQGDLHQMQPFGNTLVVLTLSGAELNALLEQQQPAGKATPTFLIPSAGLGYRWAASASIGQRVRDLRLDGVLVAPQADYRVAVNSFLADGGDGFAILRRGRDRIGAGQDLEALGDWIRSRSPAPTTEPRIVWGD